MMTDPLSAASAVIYLATPAVRDWIARCFDTGHAHGSHLVDTLPGADNVARARDVLLHLEARGWIARAAFEPMPAQRFFDSGRFLRETATHYAEAWGWAPVRTSEVAVTYVAVNRC